MKGCQLLPARRVFRPLRPMLFALLPAALAACQVGHPANADGPIDQKNWSAAGLYLAGQHAVDSGDMKTAADLLPLALQSDPTNGGLAQQALLALISDGRFEPALDLAKATNKADPKAPLASILLAADAIKH